MADCYPISMVMIISRTKSMAAASALLALAPSAKAENPVRGVGSFAPPALTGWQTAVTWAPVGAPRVYGMAVAPYGAVRLCEVAPAMCMSVGSSERLIDMDVWGSEVAALNVVINKAYKPRTDLDNVGMVEWWSLPVKGAADCEDYALAKRKALMERGWPSSALLMTVVRDEKGEGHAVLTARTVQGDFVLDNKSDTILAWNKTPYELVMRQTYTDPKVWVALEAPSAMGRPDVASFQPQR